MYRPPWANHRWLLFEGHWVAPATPMWDIAWYDQCMDAIPAEWRVRVAKIFQQKKLTQPEREANSWLRLTAESMRKLCLPLSANDDDIIVMAEKLADECKETMHYTAGREVESYFIGHRRCALYQVKPPTAKDGTMDQIRACIRRMSSANWWRRALRVAHTRATEAMAQKLNLVWLRAEKYVSETNFRRRQRQKARNTAIMQRSEIENEGGIRMSIAEAASTSTSNPAIRRTELMTRCRGFEEVADERGDKAIFITVTCPSAMHAVLSTSGQRNENWQGATPRDAQQHLVACWARTRAALARAKIKPYGIRVAEPHHDGCPHWHMLLFVQKREIKKLTDTCRKYFLDQHSPDEKGAKENRIKYIIINKERGSATGYIAKYLSKNIDGVQVQYDLYGDDAIKGSQRVEAWAATWGIRQFQQVGGPPVSVWRELRRMSPSSLYTNIVELCRAAADTASWADYVKHMGGPTCARIALALRSARTRVGEMYDAVEQRLKPAPQTQYGEPAAPKIWGIRDINDGLSFASRLHNWARVLKASARGRKGSATEDTWTRENNCTDTTERSEQEEEKTITIEQIEKYWNSHYA